MIEFLENQLAAWPLARDNYQALGKTERRCVRLGDLTVGVQHNPARIVSTAAKTDAAALAARPCFLCDENRPPQQESLPIVDGWKLLLNPYPIFPTHYTIVSETHRPQKGFPLDMVQMAEKLRGHTVFFNGAKAGASCPDHMHAQAVMTHELPLMRLVELHHKVQDNSPYHKWSVATSQSLHLDVPFGFVSVIVVPDIDGMKLLARIEDVLGREYIEEGKINIFVWIDTAGFLRIVGVPRKSHRPSCYYVDDDSRRIISPGCIDMAGVLIVPLPEDYARLSEDEIRAIYDECGVMI